MNEETPWPAPPVRRGPWSDDPGPGEGPDASQGPPAEAPDHPHPEPGPVLPTQPNKWATGVPITPPADPEHPLTAAAPEWLAARPGPGDAGGGPGDRDLADAPPPRTPGVSEQRPSSYLGGPVEAGVLGGMSPSTLPPPGPSGWSAPAPPPGQPGGGYGSPPPPPAPPAGTVRVDRAPTWVRGLAGLILFLVAGGAAYLLTQGGIQYPSEFDERVAPLAEWVAEERGLEFEHAVEVNFLTAEEYTEAITGGGSVEMDAEAVAELEDSVALLRALGLLEGDVDLAAATETLMDSGSLAFYSPETKQVYVRGTEITPAVEVTLVHELVHVVQDQHFDLGRVGDADSGQADVLRALVEGDATRVEQTYVMEELSEDERQDYYAESETAAADSMEILEESVPPVLTTVFAAPYVFGPTYVAYLEASGGNEAVDDALMNLPIERHLYNPIDIDRQGSTAPAPDVEAPEGAEELEDGDFGQITWFMLLSARLDPDTALAATDQIYEDQYVAYRQDGLVCVNLHATAWDDEGLSTLAGALEDWKAAAPEQQVEIESGDGEVVLQACDPGADSGVAVDITVETLVLPVVRSQIYAELLGTGLQETQASCGAERVLEVVGADAFTGEELSSEQQNQVVQAVAGCR